VVDVKKGATEFQGMHASRVGQSGWNIVRVMNQQHQRCLWKMTGSRKHTDDITALIDTKAFVFILQRQTILRVIGEADDQLFGGVHGRAPITEGRPKSAKVP